MPQPTPMPAFAPALSPGSFVEPELSETSVASISGVPVVAVGAGDVATQAGVLEVCAFDVVVSLPVFEAVDHGRLVITLPGGSEKTSQTALQSQMPRIGHPVPHPPMQ